ncbi:O-acetyltransferase OatA [Achromobacter veterisilvae]|uniref:O-acetyltransferase OatA n=1 Tax=Achromobacter veterisilvae TaxID=2069367 RepID=A0A446CP82_9BURK|nr:acyltransferase [Achromobacter veterisilvae]SSW69700.1 O-acetyltransferase OatA [Achromobacter veterisilvae]
MQYQSIQALRAISALTVVVFHSHWASSWASDRLFRIPLVSDFGYIGVDLFFCISGFIICHVVSSTQHFNASRFLLKRVWRIAPLYWTILTVILLWTLITHRYATEIGTLGAIGIVQSFLIFPMEPYPLLSPGWSLEHEVLFYLLAALIVPFFGTMGLLVALSCLWAAGLWWTNWDYHLFSYAQIYFAAGIAAYRLRNVLPAASGLVCLCVLTIALLLIYNVIGLPGWLRHPLFAIGFGSLISFLVAAEKAGMKFPSPLLKVGDASYSLYLVHAPVFVELSVIGHRLGMPVEIWRWFSIAVSICVAWLAYRCVELPAQALGRRLPGLGRDKPVSA